MIKNMGSADRGVRIAVALVVAVLILTHVVSGALAVILGIVAAVLLITGSVGTCPAYMVLKTSPLRK